MRRISVKICVAAALCALCLILASCSKGNKFEMSDDGMYIDKKTNISYIDAPACYEPIAMGEEIYGELGAAEFYEIQGADPTRWICEKTGSVFYARDVGLPTLDKMELSYMDMYSADSKFTTVDDAEVIAAIVDAYANGESVTRPVVLSEADYDVNWRIKLADETLGLYYTVAYFEIDGVSYLFNRFENRCVLAGEVLADYVDAYVGDAES